jgi:hypothetical protein
MKTGRNSGRGWARPGSGRPRLRLVDLVNAKRFNRQNVNHRRCLRECGSLAELPEGPVRETLTRLQLLYVRDQGLQAARAFHARQFELAVWRLGDDDGCDDERRRGVQPPQTEDRVRQESDEDRGGKVGARQVLGAFTARGGRVEPSGEPELRDPEEWTSSWRPL